MERDFFIKGDRYIVAAPAGAGGQQTVLAEGRLIDFYSDREDNVVAVVLEKGVEERRRSYAPVGAGVVVRRADPEPAEQEPEPFRVPPLPKALVYPTAPEGEFDDPQPVAWEMPLLGPHAAVVLVHEHREVPAGRLAHGGHVPPIFHEHPLLAAEDVRNPLHRHDDAHGLTPIYGSEQLGSSTRRGEQVTS